MVAKRKRITGAGPAKRPPKRRGLFPGEYERTSTVVHSEDVMEFGRLSEMNAEQREAYLRSETDGYGRSKRFFIVHTRRMDSRWTFTIESGGERWVLPLKVVEQRAHADLVHDHAAIVHRVGPRDWEAARRVVLQLVEQHSAEFGRKHFEREDAAGHHCVEHAVQRRVSAGGESGDEAAREPM